MVIGIGMGGFLDGIVFHQILQSHNMLSAILPPDSLVNVNVAMVWDGMFHVVMWVTTGVGIAMLWNARHHSADTWSGKAFLGSLFMGWGVFNVIEGLIDHYIIGIHHVVERVGLSVYDHVFVGSGILCMLAGWKLIGAGTQEMAIYAQRPARSSITTVPEPPTRSIL
jgi:uncharacterized membrane protein